MRAVVEVKPALPSPRGQRWRVKVTASNGKLLFSSERYLNKSYAVELARALAAGDIDLRLGLE